MGKPKIRIYSDYKSPDAYLVKDLACEIGKESDATFGWLPYTLEIPSFSGDAKVNQDGNVIAEGRNAHQRRRVKYRYIDCHREANQRSRTIRGPKKVFDSSLANIGIILVKRHGVFQNYHNKVFDLFCKRELNIANVPVLGKLLTTCGAPEEAFPAFANTDGQTELLKEQREAEERGVFGVPGFLFDDGELYWGLEHLTRIREILEHKN